MSLKLLEFPHSHYCEKARWALDYKKISFQAVPILPGFHIITVRKYAPETYVPVLLDNGKAIQGSSEIIDYLEQKYPGHSLTPVDADERRASLELEQTVGDSLGQNIRRILYYWLLAYPDFIRHCFTHSMVRSKQRIFTLTYPVLRRKIYQTYVISEKEVNWARRDFDIALDELETKLKGREYFIGHQFTRADLTVASMLSFLAMPSEHPLPWQEIPDPQARIIYDEYQHHPVIEWVRKMYREHRCRDRSS